LQKLDRTGETQPWSSPKHDRGLERPPFPGGLRRRDNLGPEGRPHL